ncbi:MAG: hypothetical protein ACRD0W_24450 [Acidimicrobiales bacterium]
MTGTIARVRFAKLGPHLIEVFDGGATMAEAPVSEWAPGPGAWDRRLAGLGYVRVGDWRPEDGGWVCPVKKRT